MIWLPENRPAGVPGMQLIDEGYMETDLLVDSKKRGVDLLGPAPSIKSWQDRTEDAFDHTQFHIDWETMTATCPAGKTSAHASDRITTRGTPNVLFAFSATYCLACPLRARCTRAKNVGRTLTIYPQEQYEALNEARQRQDTEEFKTLYSEHAGIEGTISQGVRSMGLRRLRYIGLAKRICNILPQRPPSILCEQ